MAAGCRRVRGRFGKMKNPGGLGCSSPPGSASPAGGRGAGGALALEAIDDGEEVGAVVAHLPVEEALGAGEIGERARLGSRDAREHVAVDQVGRVDAERLGELLAPVLE